MDIINWLEVESNIYSSGQPDSHKWQEIAALGVKTVINLRPDAELQAPEQPQVEAAGMEYIQLPIASLNDFSADVVSQFQSLLNEKGNGLLVHCASGNRVGALFALAAAADGKSHDQAMERGRSAGLTKLAPQVEMLLSRG